MKIKSIMSMPFFSHSFLFQGTVALRHQECQTTYSQTLIYKQCCSNSRVSFSRNYTTLLIFLSLANTGFLIYLFLRLTVSFSCLITSGGREVISILHKSWRKKCVNNGGNLRALYCKLVAEKKVDDKHSVVTHTKVFTT